MLVKFSVINSREDSCYVVESLYTIKTRKSTKGERYMFYIACNLFGELAWDRQDLPHRVFRR